MSVYIEAEGEFVPDDAADQEYLDWQDAEYEAWLEEQAGYEGEDWYPEYDEDEED